MYVHICAYVMCIYSMSGIFLEREREREKGYDVCWLMLASRYDVELACMKGIFLEREKGYEVSLPQFRTNVT